MVTLATTLSLPVTVLFKLYPPFTQSPFEILIAPSIEDWPIETVFPSAVVTTTEAGCDNSDAAPDPGRTRSGA
jgi:hypothetical protein